MIEFFAGLIARIVAVDLFPLFRRHSPDWRLLPSVLAARPAPWGGRPHSGTLKMHIQKRTVDKMITGIFGLPRAGKNYNACVDSI